MGHLSRPDRADKRHDNAGIAQLVEHLICNQGVAGSSPAAGTTKPPHFRSSHAIRSIHSSGTGTGSGRPGFASLGISLRYRSR